MSEQEWCSESSWGVHQGSPCEHCGMTAAERVVARLDSYTPDQHAQNIAAARDRLARRDK